MSSPPPTSRCPFLGDAAGGVAARPAVDPDGRVEPRGGTDPAAESSVAAPADRRCAATAVRWGLAGTGFLCVGLGAVGAVVPGLPTTIFLIVASWCFTRSCPWLDERMRASRIFAPYVRFLDPAEPMPARTRAIVVALVWIFAGGSAIWLATNEHPVAATCTALAAVAGTVMLLLWRREPSTVG